MLRHLRSIILFTPGAPFQSQPYLAWIHRVLGFQLGSEYGCDPFLHQNLINPLSQGFQNFNLNLQAFFCNGPIHFPSPTKYFQQSKGSRGRLISGCQLSYQEIFSGFDPKPCKISQNRVLYFTQSLTEKNKLLRDRYLAEVY